MHNIFDLKEMELEQLRSLASELEIKGFKRLDKDELVYAILDREAEINAKNAPAKEDKPRRGRPKKTEKSEKKVAKQEAEASQEAKEKQTEAEVKSEIKSEGPATKQANKRGRKSKAADVRPEVEKE